jgi:predicted glycogen debranching enzyme
VITIPRSVCIDLERSLRKEWLVANGIGGYASSTVVGTRTRRYHGLLVAALKPPVERTMLLAGVEEEVEVDGRLYLLACNEYPGGRIHPGGFVHIEEFTLRDNIPTTVYGVGASILHKTVWMEHGRNVTYVRYTYAQGRDECLLTLRPLCTFRDHHAMTQGSLDWNFGVEALDSGCKVTAYEGAAPVWLTTTPAAGFTPTGVWYWHFVYREERERGFDETEDLYVPGVLRATLRPGDSVTLVAATEPPEATLTLAAGALERERARQGSLLRAAGLPAELEDQEAAEPGAAHRAFAAQLVRAADTFMVRRAMDAGGGTGDNLVPSVLAGYHWFTDWGRDTMISLPGLCISTGRVQEGLEAVRAFAQFADEGLIPNTFPDAGGAPEYNTADATLWMFHALDVLCEAAGDLALADELYPLLCEIVAWHVRGTRHGIHVDPDDGLLMAGNEGLQLTWMDARVDGFVVTPRAGKPVEINALWYNALRVMDKLSGVLGRTVIWEGDTLPDFDTLVNRVGESFAKRFWYEEGAYLYDVVDGPEGNDPAMRPNQLLVLSLCPDLLSRDQGRSVLAAVRERLLTPYGLRTLSPEDIQYRGQITGTYVERDNAYHQGTVWTWLLGPYLDAVRAVEGDKAARTELKAMLPALQAHLADAGLGTLSEIFDGDPPHTPRGCISQAWSVAEVLRIVETLNVER